MRIQNGRQNYFQYRLRQLATNNSRELLGEREIITLVTNLGLEDGFEVFSEKTIVDLGCGDQYIKSSIQSRGGHYIGLDIDDCDFENESISLSDDSVDFAISLALIEHLYDPSNFLSECQRILKPGGTLWLSTPDIQACGTLFWNDPTHVHPYTRVSLRSLLKQQGFESILVCPNYRCMKKSDYQDSDFSFFCARHLKFLPGTSELPFPSLFKGKSTGLFGFAKK